jgi:hypothetical protein
MLSACSDKIPGLPPVVQLLCEDVRSSEDQNRRALNEKDELQKDTYLRKEVSLSGGRLITRGTLC